MSEIREIVTRAVVAKGKKIIRLKETIPSTEVCNVLGCWIINHQYEAKLCGKTVEICGNFEDDIWFSTDANRRTDIARQITNYQDTIKVRELICDYDSKNVDVTAKVIQHPTCTQATVKDEGIIVDVVFEILVEVIGETKILVTVFGTEESFDPIDDFENEINEDFMREE